MKGLPDVETLIQEHGFDNVRWIDPKDIVVAHWVRIKCLFGCGEYAKNATCPPNTPPVSDCRQFFLEYDKALLFHFSKKVNKPEDRHAWTREVNKKLSGLERDVFRAGYEKTFLLFIDSCTLCRDCAGRKEACKKPHISRPTPEAMAVDVFSTVKKFGYSIKTLGDYSEEMNRYAFLLVR